MFVNLSRLGRNGTGMWQYSVNFVNALSEIGMLSGIICAREHKAFFSKYDTELLLVPDFVSNTSKVSRLRPVLWFIYSFVLSFRLLFSRAGLVVSTTHHGLPLIRNQIITIHDLRPYYSPDSYLQRIYFRFFIPKLLRRVRHVVTVSNVVKEKISKVYGVQSERISVVYNSVDTSLFCEKDTKECYLLAVGASWAHKNIHSFLIFYRAWIKKYKLIIVCGHTEYVDRLKLFVSENELHDSVFFKHNVPFPELVELYQNASSLIYPSVDEGFGIPPVEALACKTPVIVSNIDVFKEVLGDSAIFVEPSSEVSWKLALERIDSLDEQWWYEASKCVAKYDYDYMKSLVKCFVLSVNR